MITLYWAPTSNCKRASITLAETGFASRVILVDRAGGEMGEPAFRAINPAGLVPVIIDEDGPDGSSLTLSQSGAIQLYLAEKSGRFLPTGGAARALTLQWLEQVLTDVNAAASNTFLMKNVVKEAPPEVVAFYQSRLVRYLGDCERALAEAPYLAGELSIADFALYPIVDGLRSELPGLGDFNHTLAWADGLAKRDGVRQGMAAPR